MAVEGEVLNIPFPLYADKGLLLPRELVLVGVRPLLVCKPGPVALEGFTGSSEDD